MTQNLQPGPRCSCLRSAPSADAQTYPSRPIRQIVPYASGSAADALARVAGDKLAQIMGLPVVIDSRPGANSILGAEAAAKCRAGRLHLRPAQRRGVRAQHGALSEAVLQHAEGFRAAHPRRQLRDGAGGEPGRSRAKSVEEFLAWAKQGGKDINFGSGGIGSAQHVLMEMLMQARKIAHDPCAVPRRDAGDERRRRRAHPDHDRGTRRLARRDHQRASACDRRHRPQACRRIAGRADPCRKEDRWFSGRALGRVLRAGGDARADPRQA